MVKFQTHLAIEESTLDDEFRINFSFQDKTRFDYWKRMEFSKKEWKELAKNALNKGLLFTSSAFSLKALKMLDEIGLPFIKIASGEVLNNEIIDFAIERRLPVMISTGMSNWAEIEKTVAYLNKNNIPVIVMQCTSKYPTKLEEVGLNVLDEIKKKFNTNIGLSDHSGTLFPSLAAIAMGADAIEVHVTFNKQMFGPDTIASITIEELKFLVQYRNAVKIMNENPVDKNKMAKDISGMRKLFFRSLAPSRYLKKGTILKENMLLYKKPGTGILPSQKDQIIGKRLKCDVSPKYLLKWEHIDEK